MPSARSNRQPTIKRVFASGFFFRKECARTMPDSVFRSVSANAVCPHTAAAFASSLGSEAPRKKLKLDETWSSAYLTSDVHTETIWQCHWLFHWWSPVFSFHGKSKTGRPPHLQCGNNRAPPKTVIPPVTTLELIVPALPLSRCDAVGGPSGTAPVARPEVMWILRSEWLDGSNTPGALDAPAIPRSAAPAP
jgi:hypothetical protein